MRRAAVADGILIADFRLVFGHMMGMMLLYRRICNIQFVHEASSLELPYS
jgi:hypothetical protein